MKQLVINRKWCKRCGICAESCPFKVYELKVDNSPEIAHPEKCTACGICVQRCPDLAIELEDASDGN